MKGENLPGAVSYQGDQKDSQGLHKMSVINSKQKVVESSDRNVSSERNTERTGERTLEEREPR